MHHRKIPLSQEQLEEGVELVLCRQVPKIDFCKSRRNLASIKRIVRQHIISPHACEVTWRRLSSKRSTTMGAPAQHKVVA